MQSIERTNFRCKEFLDACRLTSSLLAIGLLASCVAPGRYTSLDLSLLPCEPPGAPVFFSAVELEADGTLLYPGQKDELIHYLERGDFTDLLFFLHGWNKNPASAELDYQNFICRFDAKRQEIKRAGKLKVVGIFWPSTITNRAQEPLLVKPVSYYRIRNRVDGLAESGLAPLLDAIGDVLISLNRRPGSSGEPRRVHLVGHSFGGRMIIRSFRKLSDDNRLVPILKSVDATNVVLINAAAPPTFFDWIAEAAVNAWLKGAAARFDPSTGSFLLNLYSDQDSANKYLFRMASTFNDDPQSCAVGACGIPETPTLCVDQAGRVVAPETDRSVQKPELNVRNIDTSRVVYGHSDIYKGRMASLIADLLYDKTTRDLLLLPAPFDPRCHY